MTKVFTLLLALTTTVGLASASPLHPRDDVDVINFDGPFDVTLINMCDDDCLAEHKRDWSVSQILPKPGNIMTATTMNDFKGVNGTGGEIYHVVGKIPFTSAADKGDPKENGHVFFVDRPITKSERQASGVDAQDRNWRCTISINDKSPLMGMIYKTLELRLDTILKELDPLKSPGHMEVIQYVCSKDPIPDSVVVPDKV